MERSKDRRAGEEWLTAEYPSLGVFSPGECPSSAPLEEGDPQGQIQLVSKNQDTFEDDWLKMDHGTWDQTKSIFSFVHSPLDALNLFRLEFETRLPRRSAATARGKEAFRAPNAPD